MKHLVSHRGSNGSVRPQVCTALPCLYNLPFGVEYAHDCSGVVPLGLQRSLFCPRLEPDTLKHQLGKLAALSGSDLMSSCGRG